MGLNQVLFIEGLARTTPTHSSLINATIPVNTLLLAVPRDADGRPMLGRIPLLRKLGQGGMGAV